METRRTEYSRIILLSLFVIIITLAHYTTHIHIYQLHNIYQRLYYVPIVLAAYWYGWRGGIAVAAIISVLFLPHIIYQWGGNLFTTNIDMTSEIFMYLIIGGITGFLSHRQKELTGELEQSYRKLRSQTEALLRAEEQLHRTERLSVLGELSAGLAHEIRNPLGSILGTAEIFAEEFPPGHEKHEFTQILIREVKHLNTVLTNFLSFAGKPSLPKEKGNLNQVLEMVIGLTARQRQKADIKLETAFAPDLQAIEFDTEQLQQVLMNLILNAIQSIPLGGTLSLSTRQDEENLYCSVKDTGVGIPPENIQKIFEPFFTTKERGTGLGLSIVQRILSRHGAQISVTSQPGKGTEFVIRFPKGNQL